MGESEIMQANKKLGDFLKRLDENGELYVCYFLLVLLTSMLALQAFLRYSFHFALSWSEEILRMSFIWGIYIATGISAKRDKHIRITTQLRLFKKKTRNFILLVGDIIWVGYSVLVGIEGVKLVQSMFVYRYESPTLHINMAFPYLIVPIMYFLLATRVTQNIIRQLKTGKRRGEL